MARLLWGLAVGDGSRSQQRMRSRPTIAGAWRAMPSRAMAGSWRFRPAS